MQGWVERPSQSTERGWEAQSKGLEGLGGPTGGLGRVGRPFQKARRGREAFLDARKGSGGLPAGTGGVSRPLPEGGEGLGCPPIVTQVVGRGQVALREAKRVGRPS